MSEKPEEENEHTASSGLDDPSCCAAGDTFLDRSEEQRWKDVQRFMDSALGALSMLRDTIEGDTGYFTKDAITYRLDEMKDILDSRPF